MKNWWNDFVYSMGYLLLGMALWMILFGGSIKLGNPFDVFK